MTFAGTWWWCNEGSGAQGNIGDWAYQAPETLEDWAYGAGVDVYSLSPMTI
jgi:hypothetical protein